MLLGAITSEPRSLSVGNVWEAQAIFAGAANLSARATPPITAHQAQVIFAGAGSMRGSLARTYTIQATFAGAGNVNASNVQNPVVAFTQTFNTDTGDAPGYSTRVICATLSAGGSKIRVRFTSGLIVGRGCRFNHVSVGKRTTTYNTLATPVELLFEGASGFVIAANTTIFSDWTNFSTTIGDTLVVIQDFGVTPAYSRYNSGGGGLRYFKAATASYADSAPAGVWTTDNLATNVVEIQVGN